jgi:septal ring factor EnvC (AmiA/AmiB activator)
MFEKEAEEYGNEYCFCLADCDDKEMLQIAFQDGAEFGLAELEQQLNKKAFIISQLETQLEMVESENKKLRAKLKEI